MKWCKESSLRSDWHAFATDLIGKSEADAIQRNHGGGGSNECMEKLLRIWYNTNTSHSWETIYDALKFIDADQRVLEKIINKCTI